MCNKIFGGFFPLLKWFPRSRAFRQHTPKISSPARLEKTPINAPECMHPYTQGGGPNRATSLLFGFDLLSHCNSEG